jgi:methenyltetrahydromethanopterin cyclohydrolase
MIERASELGLKVNRLESGTTIIDAGFRAKGGLNLGVQIAKAALGGLAEVEIQPIAYSEDVVLPTVKVITDEPVVSLLACQQPIPEVRVGTYSAITSGPGRVLIRKPEEFFKISGYYEKSSSAVLILQSNRLPGPDVTTYLARECGISPKNLYLVAVPTNSISGAVQVAARVLENPLWRLSYLGFNVSKVRAAVGTAPLSPNYAGMWERKGVTPDDMILYGGRVVFFTEPSKTDNLEYLVRELVTDNSPLKGKSFFDIYTAAKSFKNIDRRRYTCACTTLYDLTNGKIYGAGEMHLDMIKRLSAC